MNTDELHQHLHYIVIDADTNEYEKERNGEEKKPGEKITHQSKCFDSNQNR